MSEAKARELFDAPGPHITESEHVGGLCCEPTLREILVQYYSDDFPTERAKELAQRYIDAYLAAVPAPPAGPCDTCVKWRRLAQEYIMHYINQTNPMAGIEEAAKRLVEIGDAAPAAEPVAQQPPPDSDAMQRDLAEILRTVGLSDSACPRSPHEVVQRKLLPRLHELMAAQQPKAPTLADDHIRILERRIRDLTEERNCAVIDLAASRERERALEADARRYRWLQAHDMRLPPAAQAHACHHPLTDDEVDRYIDAALAEQAKEQQR